MKEKTFVAKAGATRYAVAFRKYEAGSPACEWIEIHVRAHGREDATNHAKKIVRHIPGLVYEGSS